LLKNYTDVNELLLPLLRNPHAKAWGFSTKEAPRRLIKGALFKILPSSSQTSSEEEQWLYLGIANYSG
jgi:hypothetical protein